MENTTIMNENPVLDDYCVDFKAGEAEEANLLAEVELMEANSIWLEDIPSSQLCLTSIEAPMFADEAAVQYGLDTDTCADTAINGTRLILHQEYNGETVRSYCVRSSAVGTLYETAKLRGSALGRMLPFKLAETLNNGFAVANGNSLLLIRYDKVSAVHSGASSGYKIMPISQLLKTTKKQLSERFGTVEFRGGHNEHSMTSALWYLPEAKDRLQSAYNDALDAAATNSVHAIDFMPAVRFYSSDTATTSARLIPVFTSSEGVEIRFVDGVAVKHEKHVSTKDGVALYKEETDKIFPMFYDAMEKITELAKIEVRHPQNCVIGLCKKLNIPKKYGEYARMEVEQYSTDEYGETPMSAHDVYLSMCRIVTEARLASASRNSINFLSDQVARVLNIDWAEYDVGGQVSW